MQKGGAAPKDADQIVCDRCGRETVCGETEFYEMTSIGFRAGYGSIFGDGHYVAVDLCQHCLRETLGPWLRVSDDESDRERARPNEFMGTEDGQALLEDLISRMQSGAYS